MKKREVIYQKTNGHCAYCGTKLNVNNWHVEHVQPKSNGGGNNADNLLPACQRCNAAKRHREPEEFRKSIISLSVKELDTIRARILPFDMLSTSTHTTEEILYKINDLQCALSGCEIKFYIDDDQAVIEKKEATNDQTTH